VNISFPLCLALSCSPQSNCGECTYSLTIVILSHHCHTLSPLSYSLAIIIHVHHHLHLLLSSTFAITSCVLSVISFLWSCPVLHSSTVENIILSHHHHSCSSLSSTFTVVYLCHHLLCTQCLSLPLVLSCSPQLNCGEHHTLLPLSSSTFVIVIYIHHCCLPLPSPLVFSVSWLSPD
jgi:hypothetical protein